MQHSHESLAAMWTQALGDCLTRGHETNGTLELIGQTYRLDDPTAVLIRSSTRTQRWGYLGAELAWYLEGSNSLDTIAAYAPSYKRFSDDGVTLHGAYGVRGLSHQHLVAFAAGIRERPDSRQHVIPIWRPKDMVTRSKDVPCTVALHFLLRAGRLHLTTFMRSNDLGIGFVYDVPCFCLIQQFVANAVGAELGHYTHTVGSLHIYDRDRERLSSIVSSQDAIPCHWSNFTYTDVNFLRSAVKGIHSAVAPSNPGTRAVLFDMKALYDHHRRG